MAEWPELNDIVVLVRADGHRCRTRIEDVADGMLAVGAPLEPGWDAAAEGEYHLEWPSPRGLQSAPTALHHRQGGTVGLWWLEPVELPAVHQRRSYVRAPAADATIDLTWTRLARERQRGVLGDLSEGGARAVLDTWVPAQEGEEVQVRIEAGETVIDVMAEVLRAEAVRGGTEVVLTFDALPDAVADQVRQLVFGWQRLARR